MHPADLLADLCTCLMPACLLCYMLCIVNASWASIGVRDIKLYGLSSCCDWRSRNASGETTSLPVACLLCDRPCWSKKLV